jgi:hypothetical protein
MLYVQQDGVILNCYNGTTLVVAPGCGFSVARNGAGSYFVNFGFQVDNRFLSITARNPMTPDTRVGASFRWVSGNPNQVNVLTFITNVSTTGDDAYFMVIIY